MKKSLWAALAAIVIGGAAVGGRQVEAARAGAGQGETFASLSARLRDLEAKEEIRDLFNRYAFTADTGDAKGWSEVWAEQGRYEPQGGSIEGRKAFFDSIQDPEGIHKKDIEGKGSLHTTGSLMIRVDGDKAWAEGPTLVWVKSDTGYRPFSLSYNHWDLAKTNGRWEIQRRFSRPVAPGNAAQVWKSWRDVPR